MNARAWIQELARQMDAEDNEAVSLWTWLPSHAVAEKHHRDYAGEYRPRIADLMTEASMYFGYLKYRAGEAYDDREREWFERCPCGEDHDETEDQP